MASFTKSLLKRLEYKLRGDLASFALTDGTTHYYNPSSGELFLHAADCMRAEYEGKPYPEPPETIKALTKARDRRAAVEKVVTGGLFPYELGALVERGELVPRSFVAEELPE